MASSGQHDNSFTVPGLLKSKMYQHGCLRGNTGRHTGGGKEATDCAFILFAFVAESLSHVCLCHPMHCSTPGSSVLHHLPGFSQIHSNWLVMLPNHLTLCCPLLLLPSIFPSIRVFSRSWLFALGGQSIRALAST